MGSSQKVVYYYCNPKVFESIIKHKEIWLCDMSKTNDYGEIHFVLDYVADKTQQKNFFAALGKDQNRFQRYIKNILERFLKKYCWLAICFTKAGNKLLFWRTYGSDGKGFSVGFDREMLETAKEYIYSGGTIELGLREMSYGKTKRSKISETYLSKLLNSAQKWHSQGKLCKQNGKKQIHPDAHEDIENWCDDLAKEISYFKSGDFAYEEECRFGCVKRVKDILTELHKKNLEESVRGETEKTEKRRECTFEVSVTEDDAFTYLKVPFKKELVKSIWIGPRSGATEDEVRIFLASQGFEPNGVQINKSKITYRS